MNGVVVAAYENPSEGVMVEAEGGSGRFERITLRPRVTLTRVEMVERVRRLQHEDYRLRFIANSVNFPVYTELEFLVSDSSAGAGDARAVGVKPRHPARS